MENSIIRDCLKIIINCSAFLSSLKKKNKAMYFLTEVIYIFIVSSKKSRAPKAEGIPYDKGQR